MPPGRDAGSFERLRHCPTVRVWALSFLVLFAPTVWAAAPRIVIDPGHGGDKAGARAPNGAWEKTICLGVARELANVLKTSYGAEVRLTREADVDVPLSDRVARANAFEPDLFISLHANSMPTRRLRSKAHGLEVFFLSPDASGEQAQETANRENGDAPSPGKKRSGDTLSFILSDLKRSGAHADSSRLAYAVHRRLIASTGARDGGIQQAPLYVLTGLDVPAVLVEVGFISHPAEGVRLQNPNYQRKLVRGLAEGISDFLREIARRNARKQLSAAPGSR